MRFLERGELLAIFFAAQCPWALGLLFPAWYGWALQASFKSPVALSAFFPNVFYAMISIFVDLLHLGGDPCRSVGDQPPLPSPRGDPARLGTLSADPPLVVLLYSSCAPPPLRIILFSFSLVEVNQAILAWSFYWDNIRSLLIFV